MRFQLNENVCNVTNNFPFFTSSPKIVPLLGKIQNLLRTRQGT
jgi:hypothetical protein